MVLVFLVVFLFLQNWRATLIPFAAVPVSLIGSFADLQLLGYTIHTLTLLGQVLSMGHVVDTAHAGVGKSKPVKATAFWLAGFDLMASRTSPTTLSVRSSDAPSGRITAVM